MPTAEEARTMRAMLQVIRKLGGLQGCVVGDVSVRLRHKRGCAWHTELLEAVPIVLDSAGVALGRQAARECSQKCGLATGGWTQQQGEPALQSLQPCLARISDFSHLLSAVLADGEVKASAYGAARLVANVFGARVMDGCAVAQAHR